MRYLINYLNNLSDAASDSTYCFVRRLAQFASKLLLGALWQVRTYFFRSKDKRFANCYTQVRPIFSSSFQFCALARSSKCPPIPRTSASRKRAQLSLVYFNTSKYSYVLYKYVYCHPKGIHAQRPILIFLNDLVKGRITFCCLGFLRRGNPSLTWLFAKRKSKGGAIYWQIASLRKAKSQNIFPTLMQGYLSK
jgi:hypothetical protein